jgi:hypothetical protein
MPRVNLVEMFYPWGRRTPWRFGKMAGKLRFSIVPGRFAVSRLAPHAPIPDWIRGGPFACLTRTAEELSVVSLAEGVPPEVQSEKQWSCLKLLGPFPFQETGILASFIDPCAQAGIPIFAVSTFDTDYVLVKDEDKERALATLLGAGHELVN